MNVVLNRMSQETIYKQSITIYKFSFMLKAENNILMKTIAKYFLDLIRL